MADLSAVLRKTIDGLPRATPDLRAKVYEKARSAIERQIATASPPLSESVIEARRSALADAIDRTEDHYLDLDAAGSGSGTAREVQAVAEPPKASPPRPQPERTQPDRPEPERGRSDQERLEQAKTGRPEMPRVDAPRADRGPSEPLRPPVPSPAGPALARPSLSAPAQKPAWPKVAVAETGELRRTEAGNGAPQVRPEDGARRPISDSPVPARPKKEASAPSAEKRAPAVAKPGERREPGVDVLKLQPTYDRTEPESGLDSIPAADIAAPRYTNGRRPGKAERSRTPILAGLAILLLGGGAALAYVYQNEIQALLNAPASETTEVAATTAPATTAAAPDAGQATPATTPPVATSPPVAGETPVAPPAATPDDANDEIAALTPDNAAEGIALQSPKRRFTQRLMPDGTEVDEGPGTPDANAFDEGTNIAAASPPETSSTLAPAIPPAATDAAAIPGEPGSPVVPPATPDTAPVEATPPAAVDTQTAALPPESASGALAVGQKAVFYEERTETEQGSQQAGNVVWSVVNESPSEGQPPEPAIRAVADIPDRNLKLTMTIRRNADATLPASHVIELMFEVPENFAGGQIANVQRLALKPTEEARGEPLIGVAGQISEGFFIIALNNLEQATKSNLDLMGREEWIDIPIAYATGRRALISIDKGIPGDRAFKQAMDAWAAKT
ncbi:hypothetical protein Sa4125_07860 [Aureimonas sp. SA4125]|uniref:hypothetical protein n=1 Tax=Aureimonas sp. SA4125 TaxID=2826993 RepID=UPI001CC4E942|nr:hypothetical protein [Aureimonas sp. SA4125]BDA83244.1 hypothetical protein Sa4125_07860 [Aureimonas sp. SA4125]